LAKNNSELPLEVRLSTGWRGKVKLHVSERKPQKSQANGRSGPASEERVRVQLTPALFGRRAVKAHLHVEPVYNMASKKKSDASPRAFANAGRKQHSGSDSTAHGPVRVTLVPARFGKKVRVHFHVFEERLLQLPPNDPVSVKLVPNWRGRVKVQFLVTERLESGKLVQAKLSPQRFGKGVAVQLNVL